MQNIESIIKVGFLLSYDYEYVKESLPKVYNYADLIVFSIDINRITYTGNKYEFDEEIFEWINNFDWANKIKIYQDNFYVVENTPMENEVRQRNMMSEFMGKGGWHLHIDVDESFVRFNKFVKYLRSKEYYLINPEKRPVTILAPWFNLIKNVDGGYIYSKYFAFIPIATNCPRYIYGRETNSRKIFTNFIIIHQSYNRGSEKLEQKIKNFSHHRDGDTKFLLDVWSKVSDKKSLGQLKDIPFTKGSALYNFFSNLDIVYANGLNELEQRIITFKKYRVNSFRIITKNFKSYLHKYEGIYTVLKKVKTAIYK